jgi:carboxyl-terminal processing protease
MRFVPTIRFGVAPAIFMTLFSGLVGLTTLFSAFSASSARAASLMDNPQSRLMAEAWLEAGLNLRWLTRTYFDTSSGSSLCLQDTFACMEGFNRGLHAMNFKWSLQAAAINGSSEVNGSNQESILFEGHLLRVVARERKNHLTQKTQSFARQNEARRDERARRQRLAIDFERNAGNRTTAAGTVAGAGPTASLREDFTRLKSFVQEALRENSNLEGAFIHGFLNGFAAARDPFAAVVPVEWDEQQHSSTSDIRLDLGLQVKSTSEGLLIDSVAPDSAASQAGFHAGDIALTLNDQDLKRLSQDEVKELILKDQTFWRVRRGKHILSITFQPGQKEVPKFESSRHLWRGQTYLHLRLHTFTAGGGLCGEIGDAIEEAKRDVLLAGIVLDLRGNPGGDTGFTACVASIFLGPDRLLATIKGLNGEDRDALRTLPSDMLETLRMTVDRETPLAVLINGESASAAELTAGALRDYGRAWNIGQLSFGKGSITTGRPWALAPDRALEYKTDALFFQPNGTSNQMVGILPDFFVPSRLGASPESDFVARNADLNPDAPFKVNDVSPPPRPIEIARVKSCINADFIASHQSASDQSPLSTDYQLAYSLETLHCSGLAPQERQ